MNAIILLVFSASWIGFGGAANSNDCPVLRKSFTVKNRPVASARAKISAAGFCELMLNKVNPDPKRVMSPAVTRPELGFIYDEYDFAKYLQPGKENHLELQLAPGYDTSFNRYGWRHEGLPRAWFELDIRYEDGSVAKVESDGSWTGAIDGQVVSASIYHGEVRDMRKSPSAFSPVRVYSDLPAPSLTSPAPPIRLSDPRAPEKIMKKGDGRYILDFGQNRAGIVCLRAKGTSGTVITIHTAEELKDDGELDDYTNRNAASTDTFILAGSDDTERFFPRFTYHCFRYAEIRGYPGELKANDVRALALHADVKPTVSFKCSDETLMKLHNAAKWSMLSNFMSYPSDCPVRDERTPCLMDSQAYEDAACQAFDMRGFYAKWMRDNSVSGGWPDWGGDVAALPYRLWFYYGERDQLERDYPVAKRWVDGMLAYPDYYIEKNYGDWCPPNPDGRWEDFFREPPLVNSALFCEHIRMVAEMARALGKTDDAALYSGHHDKAKAAFHKRFFDAEKGVYSAGNQTTFVLPLAFGLVPDKVKPTVVSNFIARIHADGDRIDVGIFGNRYIYEVLCDLGEVDLAYHLATQPEYPGFGYLFSRGATTLWEQWNYHGAMHSHSHAMMSGGTAWLYTRLAGIRPLGPGYEEVEIKPCFPRAISSLEVTRMTPRGEIRVKWLRAENGEVKTDVYVPETIKYLR